ncbi:MAG: hypothetical protein JXQ93_11655 [Flavobacteriaceae bacterium]
MKTIKRVLLLVFTAFTIVSCNSDSDFPNPLLTIELDGREILYIPLVYLKDNLISHQISIFDPVHGKQKNYRAFLLREVLVFSYGTDLTSLNLDDVTLTYSALDGFSATATGALSIEQGGYIAYEDLDIEGPSNWERVAPENNNDPAPLYIVWSGDNQNPTTDGYPWPYQLSKINLTR